MTTERESLFPAVPRVRYVKAPLFQVTCQLKFPPILRIASESPARFQDRIRGKFPFLQVIPPIPQAIPGGFPQLQAGILQVLQTLQAQLPTGVTHQFTSEDRKSFVELSSESLAFVTVQYETWGAFRSLFADSIKAFFEIYSPSFLSRVGLRYQDLIDRESLSLKGVSWSELIQKNLLGEIADDKFERNLLDARRLIRVNLPSGIGTMLLQHGLVTNPNKSESAYTIDLDFSTEQRTEVSDADGVLNNLHREVGHAFRWCITDRLHDALEPVELRDEFC